MDFTFSKVNYYITPSQNVSCPQSPCLTLSQFAVSFNSYDDNETNVTITFLPGNHILDRVLSFSHSSKVSMTKYVEGNETVFVECSNNLGMFDVRETTFVSIKSLHFIGCGGNTITQVEQLIVEDSIFLGMNGRGRALVLNKVAVAAIVRSSFLSNIHSDVSSDTDEYIISFQNETTYFSPEQGVNKFGGALYIVYSNVWIVRSQFLQNTAGGGGAIAAHSSKLHVNRSTYSYNRASVGGVLFMSECSVNIVNSSFGNNEAMGSGGVMTVYKGSVTISGASFTNNSASVDGGVITMYESSFNVTDTILRDNTAEEDCGAICTTNSSFEISNAIFTDNYSGRSGGVLHIENDSYLKIIASTFANNSAAESGGVLYVFQSQFNISDCMFSSNTAYDGGAVAASESSFNISGITGVSNSAADHGGVVYASNCSFTITSSSFTNNYAGSGGVTYTIDYSVFSVINSAFSSNTADTFGGVVTTYDSTFKINDSNLTSNLANDGGGIAASRSSFNISRCTLTHGLASYGGIIYTAPGSSFSVTNSTFYNNNVGDFGGAIATFGSSYSISNSNFTGNAAGLGGGSIASQKSLFNIHNSMFTYCNAYGGGVIYTEVESSYSVANSSFESNSAIGGGVLYANHETSFNITGCSFSNNQATLELGGAVITDESSFNIFDSSFTLNTANFGAAIACTGGSVLNTISNVGFSNNTAFVYGGAMLSTDVSIFIANCTFEDNIGSLFSFNSNLTFAGLTRFENCVEYPNKTVDHLQNEIARDEGGAITSFQSSMLFTGVSTLLNNQAGSGGAILATESTIALYGEVVISNNMASSSNGGGMSLQLSDLKVRGNCNVTNNRAIRGGGIHSRSSIITIHKQSILQLASNIAEDGGGIYMEVNPKLYLLKPERSYVKENYLIFRENHAWQYGGAAYVEDGTSNCSPNTECSIQVLAVHPYLQPNSPIVANVIFSENTASKQGSDLFGGLFDRCIPSPFAEVYLKKKTQYSGVDYLQNITNVALDAVGSQPVRVCFCTENGQQDCSLKLPPIKVRKGEEFTVSVVAVDHVNHSVDANIISFLTSSDGGFGEGQQIQRTGRKCTNLTLSVFSPHDSEIVSIYADGPCGNTVPSIQYLNIHFLNCTCPVGFEPSNSKSTRCECICDSEVSSYTTSCNYATNSLLRVDSISWITYMSDPDQSGYVIHPFCPYDYCQSPNENVSVNLNVPNGADTQCALDHAGVLCGACRQGFSLSLGSSRCLPCHNYWPAVFLAIILAAIIAGILIVAAMLVFNITVANGLVNGFIFYANIVAANGTIFFPSSELSFPAVFVAWLNLKIGIDVCFINGLDAFTKHWFQLAFPIYIISLVVAVIIAMEYSPRFAGLLGKRDPVATLATLILVSYAKLLSVTITVLSFAELDYPGGSHAIVWLPDGNVKYFESKHAVLLIVAIFIILIGVPFTILLFLWQWLVRAPLRWKVFRWTRNTKLNAFIATYHAPYNVKYRYWTGLLLLVRIALYITASVTTSANPQTSLLTGAVLVGGLILLRVIMGGRVYKKVSVDIVETILLFNFLVLATFSLYDFKIDNTKQTAVAYTSTIITFVLLLGVVVYHVYLLIKKAKVTVEVNEYPTAPVERAAASEITQSVIEMPRIRGESRETCETTVTTCEYHLRDE